MVFSKIKRTLYISVLKCFLVNYLLFVLFLFFFVRPIIVPIVIVYKLQITNKRIQEGKSLWRVTWKVQIKPIHRYYQHLPLDRLRNLHANGIHAYVWLTIT